MIFFFFLVEKTNHEICVTLKGRKFVSKYIFTCLSQQFIRLEIAMCKFVDITFGAIVLFPTFYIDPQK